MNHIVVPIDADEAIEACAVFDRWSAKLDQLPRHLRDQVVALASQPPGAAVEHVRCGAGVAVQLTPAARCLVAALRALDGAPFP